MATTPNAFINGYSDIEFWFEVDGTPPTDTNVTMTWGDGREEETLDNILHFDDGFLGNRFTHRYVTESV